MFLLDSDILIDCLRFQPTAIAFVESLDRQERHISTVTQLELMRGCKTKEQLHEVQRFLKRFKILPLNPNVSKKAVQIYQSHCWQRALEIPDTLIGATALVNKLILLSRNLKHFKNIPELEVKAPY